MGGRLRRSELLLLAGLLALFGSTFFAWFVLSPVTSGTGEQLPNVALAAGEKVNVWGLHFGRFAIYLAILSAAWLLAATLLGHTPGYATLLATPVVIFGLLSSLTMIYRLFSVPLAGSHHAAAFYVGLAGSLVIFAGGFWSMRDESVPSGFADAPQPELLRVER